MGSIRLLLLFVPLFETTAIAQTGVKVSGRVLAAPGSTITRASASLSAGRTRLSAQVSPDGNFEFEAVPPGKYSATVLGSVTTVPKQILVDTEDMTGIELIDCNWNTATQGLEQLWTLNGRFSGVVWDARANVIRAVSGATLLELDSAGRIMRQTPFGTAPTLRLAHFASQETVLLAFGTWSPDVRAVDLNGTELWRYTAGAVDDVYALDLDGDQSDEVIVGLNGSVGLHVLNSDGQLLWKSTDIGNVWHVSAGDVLRQGAPQVVTTSARGQVHVFSDNGNSRTDLVPGFYANMIRTGKVRAEDAGDTLFVGGTSSDGPLRLAALAGDGSIQWTNDLSFDHRSIYSISLAEGKPWIAAGLQGGEIVVVNAEGGVTIAAIDGQGFSPETTWMKSADDENSVLIVSTGSKLSAFRVTPGH